MPGSPDSTDGLTDGLTEDDIDLLRQRAARYARRPEAALERVTDAVVFKKGDARYAAPLGALREIRRLPALCCIPGAAPAVPGVFHFQGEILSAHALDAFMGHRGGAASPWILIVEHEGERLGLLADEVIDIMAVAAADLSPVPLTFGERAACFQGVFAGGALLLEPARLFSTPSFFAAF